VPSERPSFTDDVKAELAGLQPARPCCQHAELHAIVEALIGHDGDAGATVRVPRNATARKVVHLVKATDGRVEELRKGVTERRPTYRLRLALRPSAASGDVCCARARIRGAFLAKGTLGNPAGGYHLEIALAPGAALGLKGSLEHLDLPSRTLLRRGLNVWYLKGAEPISRVLRLMGANRAVMRFEHDRIVRDMRSQANRRVNSETANLDKRLRTAFEQVKRIRQLQRGDPGLTGFPPALRQAAQLRLAHPHAGLLQLAAVAHVSKGAIAGRLRRLMTESRQSVGRRETDRLSSTRG
jgi:cell division protein WhiA